MKFPFLNRPQKTEIIFMNSNTRLKIKFPVFLLIIFIISSCTFFIMDYIRNGTIQMTDNYLVESSDNIQEFFRTSGVSDYITDNRPVLADNGNFTSVLVVGIDARNVEIRNGEFINTQPEGQIGLRNTDSIMQIIFDHRTSNVFMISIPRDMGVDVRENCYKFSGSLHKVYDESQKKNCPGGGIQILKNTISNITGIPIKYHVFISLDAFQEIIKTVGKKDDKGNTGIVVDNPRSFSDIYPASNQKGWESVYFPKGQLFLTPYRALQYSRTRQYTSDWDRAHRQQLVVEAVVRSVLSSETLLNPDKISGLLTTYQNKVIISQPNNIFEIIGLIDLVRKIDTTKMYNLVLGPEFGGHEKYLNKQPHDRSGGPYYMVPTAWKSCPGNEFCKVQEYIQQIILEPELLVDNSF